MVLGVPALQKDVMMVLKLVAFASNTVHVGSALGNGAPRLLMLEEGVPSTRTARKSALL